jgi:hypothetical protein
LLFIPAALSRNSGQEFSGSPSAHSAQINPIGSAPTASLPHRFTISPFHRFTVSPPPISKPCLSASITTKNNLSTVAVRGPTRENKKAALGAAF